MRKDTGQWIIEGALECLLESETLFVYLVVPLLCVVFLCVVSIVVYSVVCDASFANAASTLDGLSIDPDKWFPRT